MYPAGTDTTIIQKYAISISKCDEVHAMFGTIGCQSKDLTSFQPVHAIFSCLLFAIKCSVSLC